MYNCSRDICGEADMFECRKFPWWCQGGWRSCHMKINHVFDHCTLFIMFMKLKITMLNVLLSCCYGILMFGNDIKWQKLHCSNLEIIVTCGVHFGFTTCACHICYILVYTCSSLSGLIHGDLITSIMLNKYLQMIQHLSEHLGNKINFESFLLGLFPKWQFKSTVVYCHV